MYCTRKLTEQVWWVGGSDRRLALFENLFPITRGVSYNSYLILDEQTAVAVSYTHLDVYKRQPCLFVFLRNLFYLT